MKSYREIEFTATRIKGGPNLIRCRRRVKVA